MAIRRKLIRQLVEDLLAEHQITSGPVPVAQIAESFDIEIARDPVDNDLSGFLYREKESGRTVIGVNGSHPERRQRFTIAHELGHYLLHEGEVAHVDQEAVIFTMDFRDGRSSTGDSDSEREANLFAAELLMPARFIRGDLSGQRIDLLDDDDNETLAALADKYGVSLQALTFRLTNLEYVVF